jgi:hypothetical protein
MAVSFTRHSEGSAVGTGVLPIGGYSPDTDTESLRDSPESPRLLDAKDRTDRPD